MNPDLRHDWLLDRLNAPDPQPPALSPEVAAALRSIRARRRLTAAGIGLPIVLMAVIALPWVLRPPTTLPPDEPGLAQRPTQVSAWTLASLNAANADRSATDLDLPPVAAAPGPFPRLTDRSLAEW